MGITKEPIDVLNQGSGDKPEVSADLHADAELVAVGNEVAMQVELQAIRETAERALKKAEEVAQQAGERLLRKL
ncbi:hypothetical protein A3B60_03135 [Candidatus Peregrinibacteria bacterium RIFCSPLOWO2_01_FULL_39_12]|nr:MAG: hypothetical protein A3B60_03135 [Candidatus Peregrinibacteria bacterium RIFCSPLOWO2_01_FULL_39_12]OGJ42683.1 MAG: hypothetical protein A3I58_00205 [Candidatus Peregrinibacteria bacterium RIFCSPLOWO2_02_FULL_39_10]